MNTITLIAIVVAALAVGALLQPLFKRFGSLLWEIVVGPWYLFFSSLHETGNGAGVFGALLGLIGIAVQFIAIALAAAIGLGIYLCVR